MIVKLFLLIGAMFGALAAFCAALIVYEENRKHGLSDRQLRSRVLRTAITAFLALVILAAFAGVVVQRFVQ